MCRLSQDEARNIASGTVHGRAQSLSSRPAYAVTDTWMMPITAVPASAVHSSVRVPARNSAARPTTRNSGTSTAQYRAYTQLSTRSVSARPAAEASAVPNSMAIMQKATTRSATVNRRRNTATTHSTKAIAPKPYVEVMKYQSCPKVRAMIVPMYLLSSRLSKTLLPTVLGGTSLNWFSTKPASSLAPRTDTPSPPSPASEESRGAQPTASTTSRASAVSATTTPPRSWVAIV